MFVLGLCLDLGIDPFGSRVWGKIMGSDPIALHYHLSCTSWVFSASLSFAITLFVLSLLQRLKELKPIMGQALDRV